MVAAPRSIVSIRIRRVWIQTLLPVSLVQTLFQLVSTNLRFAEGLHMPYVRRMAN